MRLFHFIFFVLLAAAASAQSNTVGIFQDAADIGKPKNGGSTKMEERKQTYILKGAGYNIWFGRDEFQFAYKKLKGDFILTADFEFVGNGTDPHRKIGWMVRQSAADDAPHITATLHGDGLTALQWRQLKGAHMRDPEDQVSAPKKYYQTLRLERIGKTVTMFAAHRGEPLQRIGSQKMEALPDEILAGLFICSHNESIVEEARVWNVRIDQPVPDDFNAYRQGFLGSRLEILDMSTGLRKVIHEAKGRFEAPNWMPDGKKLLFNQDGSLFTIPIEGGTPEKINTGIANRNNNDHGISFDKKMLAISHHRDGLPGGGSTVYVLPLSGGEPKLITEKTPSYWHGWNPNGKDVLFVGQREGTSYDIYKISVTGGPEIKLTDSKNGIADGPEYSPDGKYIYYNANPTGTMQIWRMKPDGSAKEQITFDEYNNWFPHLSPDGKWIVIISFPPEIPPNDHPFYKRVMLRLMPATGGAPKVLAHLYGGQGTINVPSWSPDSKFIAFVSNSDRTP
jgi:Tol biopolymer transport system component